MAFQPAYYSDMHIIGASIDIAVAATNTWYPIPSGSGLVSSDHNGWTLSTGNTLTCNEAGVYQLTLTASVQCASANQLISMSYAQNGTGSTNVTAQSELVDSGKLYQLAVTDIQTFSNGDTLTIVLQNNTAIHDLTVVNVTLTVVRLK